MKEPDGPGRITQKDLARRLGLTQATVSMALQNSPRITEKRRREVQAAAAELGYQPNPTAASLARYKPASKLKPVRSALAWLNCWPGPQMLRAREDIETCWRGAEAAAQGFGYRLEEFIAHPGAGEHLSPDRIEKVLLARGIDGILLPPHPGRTEWGDFRWERFAVVRVGSAPPMPRVHLVAPDHAGDAILAYKEMSARGYRRVGLVRTWKEGEPASAEGLFAGGFLAAQLELEKEGAVAVLTLQAGRPDSHRAGLARWLKQERPDAILTGHATMGGLLMQCGYRVPEDIGLAGSSLRDTDAMAGTMSGIEQFPREVGRLAARLLISQINENSRGEPAIAHRTLVPGKWVDGGSLPGKRPFVIPTPVRRWRR